MIETKGNTSSYVYEAILGGVDIQSIPFMTIFDMPVDEIKTASFNPLIRESEKNLKPLLAFLRGKEIPPVWLSRDGILGDGHRRLACAKIMGYQTIKAIRFDLTVEEVWAMNFGTRPITPKEIMMAYSLGFRNIPDKKLGIILALQHIVGEAGVKELARLGVSPHVLHIARRVANYCQNEDNEFLKTALWWLVNTGQQFMARKAMDGGIDPGTLEKAVMENKKIMHSWGI